jgi:hypothetical protein
MTRVTLLLAVLLFPHAVSAQAPGHLALPLKEGRYSAGGCDRFNEADGYIGIGIHKEGPNKGRQFLVPQAERQQGFCTLLKLAPMGGVLGGVAECDNGSRSNPGPLGTYRFNYTVHDTLSFSSLGKRYGWCPPRR